MAGKPSAQDMQLGYLDVYKHNVMIPLVKVTCDFKRPLVYGDTAVVETRFVNTEAAKIVFEYTVYRKSDNGSDGHRVLRAGLPDP